MMNKIKFRKPSDTISSTDSTLQEILAAGEIPKMELLKINYVNFSNPPDPFKVAQRRLPSERIEDQKQKRQSLDGYFNRKLFTTASSNNAEKSNSWDYRTKNVPSQSQGTIDIAVTGHRSRANRIANIEKIACEHERSKEEKLKNAKSCSDVSRINKLFEVAAKKSEHRGEKVKRLSENFECICTSKNKSNSLRYPLKATQLSEFNNENVAKINEKIKRIFEIPAPPPTPPSPVVLPKNIKQTKKNNDRVHVRKKQRQSLLINEEEISIFDRGVNFSTHNNSCSIIIKANDDDDGRDDDQMKKTIKENNLKNSEHKRFSIILNDDEESCKNKKLDSSDEEKLKTTTTICDLNDVQNFSKKNLIKITTDDSVLAKTDNALNNTVPKNTKRISLLNKTNNDLKDQPQDIGNNSVKIFVRNPSFSTHSVSSSSTLSTSSSSCASNNQTFSATTKLLSDCGYYDRVTEPRNSLVSSTEEEEDFYDECNCSEDEGVGDSEHTLTKRSHKSLTSIQTISSSCSSSKDLSGCDVGGDGVFWNNCYFYDDSFCCSNYSMCDDDNCTYSFVGECCNDEEEINRRGGCCCNNKRGGFKTDVISDLRPRSMDGVVDSGISLNGDISSSPDCDLMQNQQDIETRRLKRGHVLTELLETERIYVSEMSSILKGYRDQMQSEELVHLVPASLQGKEDVLFGNLHELYKFHSEVFLKDLEKCISTTELVALCFVQRRDTFYRLYSFYCQNIPRSERLRETLVDTHLFLQECQKRLGHKLPLAAYLLKPVQRITKYQLLLKDLLRFSDNSSCTKELQKALDCMLIVLKCVNDSMHQIAITGFPNDLSQQGELLLQDSFQVLTEAKKDIRLRLKPQQRHIFLYQKSMLFCKQTSKTGHNKSTYQYKNFLKMSQVGLTESVRGDQKRFELWLQGRQEVYTLQAATVEIKNKWVAEIKRVLFNQLEELKGEKIKQYGQNCRHLKQMTSWDPANTIISLPQRNISCDTSSESNRNSNGSSTDDHGPPHTPGVNSLSSSNNDGSHDACGWSSDYSNSDDELSMIEENNTPGSRFVALADYCAVSNSEVSMKEGDYVELLKVGMAGWWFIRILDSHTEGWAPAAYLGQSNKKPSRSSSRNQDRVIIIP